MRPGGRLTSAPAVAPAYDVEKVKEVQRAKKDSWKSPAPVPPPPPLDDGKIANVQKSKKARGEDAAAAARRSAAIAGELAVAAQAKDRRVGGVKQLRARDAANEADPEALSDLKDQMAAAEARAKAEAEQVSKEVRLSFLSRRRRKKAARERADEIEKAAKKKKKNGGRRRRTKRYH